MDSLTAIYWIRVGLGLIAGFLCAAYVYFSNPGELASLYTLLTGLSLALIFYIISYYFIKLRFFARIEKPSKLMTQGIGIYFFAWIVSWILVVTMIMPLTTVRIYDINTGDLAEGRNLWIVAYNYMNQPVQNVTTTSGVAKMTLLPPGTYTFQQGNTNQNQTFTLTWLQTLEIHFNIT
ncbi:MAG: hypothetical protein JSV05_06525 [Candidatus Bathyarchaeota archaeon]|nr:MAG: hypothetical protein JSV05_06525 [Candidatus Bathyarchaeota archaeon]